jgi:hypothetical protein
MNSAVIDRLGWMTFPGRQPPACRIMAPGFSLGKFVRHHSLRGGLMLEPANKKRPPEAVSVVAI